MALGSSVMLGIRLPVNFHSPYKAASIIEFWRRWHISLSAFLRDYLYIPLGGNRRGRARRYLNLFITMLLGGLWHGANWTFMLWGGLHGFYLSINHAFRHATRGMRRRPPPWLPLHAGVGGADLRRPPPWPGSCSARPILPPRATWRAAWWAWAIPLW